MIKNDNVWCPQCKAKMTFMKYIDGYLTDECAKC